MVLHFRNSRETPWHHQVKDLDLDPSIKSIQEETTPVQLPYKYGACHLPPTNADTLYHACLVILGPSSIFIISKCFHTNSASVYSVKQPFENLSIVNAPTEISFVDFL